ncbi:MAG TPA: thiamine pyrophosphate-dependent enzyme [Daejeonella sp.]|nr:thiamine pyrophosphate-dependent enzyme [Daejeonella sp.]
MSKNVADQVVEMLVASGIKRVYAITGDSLNEFNDAVRRQGSIQWIHVRHEETGAFAAAAEGELNGLACCAGSSGPGHVHLINGLYDANRSGVPLIAIAATCPTTEFGTDYFQETSLTKLFDDCSCYNQTATTPVQATRMLQAAIQQAIHKKGVAIFGLPGDIAALPAGKSAYSGKNYFTEAILRPSDQEMRNLAALLNKASKITLFCGIGAQEAHDEIIELAGLLKSPIAYSFRGKMGIQYNNPYEIGMTGLLGLPAAYHSMHESDILLLLGTDFPYSVFLPDDKKIIQIDAKPEKLGRRATLELGLCGNIKDTILALLPLIEAKADDSFLKSYLQLYDKVKETMLTYVRDSGEKDAIHPEFVASTLNELADDEAIFTVDTGMCCVWGARYIDATKKRNLLGSFNHGSMANAMPMAIGAALAQPDRQIIALCGDGGLSMFLGDLATIKQYNLPIKLVVFNNRSLGMVRLEMQVTGLPDNQTDMINPDFALVAEAMGIKGITVHEPSEVRQVLMEAFQHPGPVLVNIMTDPEALAMPPKIEFDQVKGFAITMGKMILGGRMDEILATIQSNYKHLKEIL